MIRGSIKLNMELIMESIQTGEKVNLCEDSFYVQFHQETKTIYLWYKNAYKDKSVLSYKAYNLTDYAFIPYYIQGAVEVYVDNGLPF